MSRTRRSKANVQGRLIQAGLEALEQRQFLSVSNWIAIFDGTNGFGNTRRAINYYNVSNLPTSTPGVGGTFFGATPEFSVWTGYERTVDRNPEDPAAMAVNPLNGTTYLLAFDSGTPGAPSLGDTPGDYDLYRIDFQEILTDYITNSRPKGIMYAPRVSPDGIDYYRNDLLGGGFNGTAQPPVTPSDIGVPPLRNNTNVATKDDIIFLPNMIQKVGEIERRGGDSIFFDQQDLQFVNDSTLLLMENKLVNESSDFPTLPVTNDYSIRTIERVSTSPGLASDFPATETGGYNGAYPSTDPDFGTPLYPQESWQAFAWTGDNYVDMDDNTNNPGQLSEVDGMRYVERDGVKGVWVSERDGGGDDFAFFKLDFTNRIATKQELKVGNSPFAKAFALDEDPVGEPNGNSGDVGFFDTDFNGRLIIGEDGFNDTPKHEPKVITRTITNYNGGDSDGSTITEVLPGGWNTGSNLVPTIDDDAGTATEPTSSTFGVSIPAQNYTYFFDVDSGVEPGVIADVYVVDTLTGAVIYEELNAVNHFFSDANRIRGFTIDTDAPTVVPDSFQFFYNTPPQAFQFKMNESVYSTVQLTDVSVENLTTSTIINPTSFSYNFNTNAITFRYNSILPNGNYRVTLSAGNLSDPYGNALAGNSTFDFFFVNGDANHSRQVDPLDTLILANNWLQTGKTFSEGDFDYDGDVDAADLGILGLNWLTVIAPPAPPPPPAPPAPPAPAATVASSILKSEPVKTVALTRTAVKPASTTGLTRVAVR